jgi:hypothetical protein
MDDCRKCQTVTATPAEPGDLPWTLEFAFTVSFLPFAKLLGGSNAQSNSSHHNSGAQHPCHRSGKIRHRRTKAAVQKLLVPYREAFLKKDAAALSQMFAAFWFLLRARRFMGRGR